MKRPGLTIPQIAAWLDVKSDRIHPLLVTMEKNGYLLSEDDAGRLYPFARLADWEARQ